MANRLMARLRGAVARAVVSLVNDGAMLQALQVRLGADVVRDKAEHFQHYGFTSVAHPGAEGVALSVGASSDHTVVICVDDRRFRLKGLEAGEAALYDDLGHTVHLTRAGIVIDGGGHPVLLTNLAKLRVEADIESTGQIKDLCDGAGKTMSAMRAAYNGHVHPENDSGGPTGGPNPAM